CLERLAGREQQRGPATQREHGRQLQAVELGGKPLAAIEVRAGTVDVTERDLDEREDLPVDATLDGDLVLEVVAAERMHDLPRALHVAVLKARAGQLPARPAARRRHRAAGKAPADPRALLARRDRRLEVARVVVRPAELVERPEEVVVIA